MARLSGPAAYRAFLSWRNREPWKVRSALRRDWAIKGDLSDVAIDVEYTKLHNQDPVRFAYADQTLQIEPAHMIGEGTDVTGRGSIHFAGSKELDLAADGQADLKLLGALDPNLSSSGLTTHPRECDGYAP